jgi:hypothetical protein
MTDRTHPDSGRIITSSDILLHDAETALMYEELRAAIDDGHESMTHADALAEIAAIRAENVELRAKLEAVGAGGVQALSAAPAPLIARSLAEWHEDDGCVAWWAWNGHEWAGEPACIGTPNCEDWPGYHTHWTPHPDQPVFSALAAQGGK